MKMGNNFPRISMMARILIDFFFIRLLTFSRIQDMMPLEAGWYFYQQGSTLNLGATGGFKKRMKLFLKEGSSTVYSGEAVTMYGPVYHDLISCQGTAIILVFLYSILGIAQISQFIFKSNKIMVGLSIARVSPGLAIDLNLWRNRPEIAIDCFDSGTLDYVFNIKS